MSDAPENRPTSDDIESLRGAMLDPAAPTPSVETILHAIIPFRFVDHTHADAVVTIMNTPDGEERMRQLYGPNMLIVPYVMPGFILARTVYEMTRDIDWSKLEGILLMNHGVFTFADDAKTSYERHFAAPVAADFNRYRQRFEVERGSRNSTPWLSTEIAFRHDGFSRSRSRAGWRWRTTAGHEVSFAYQFESVRGGQAWLPRHAIVTEFEFTLLKRE